ncbi:ferredoxin, partial [Patescibacteria group bacterium]|nr:ferredoxin [Patescibacteria group bacterium]
KAVLKDSGDMKCAQEAVDVCPVQAIEVEK